VGRVNQDPELLRLRQFHVAGSSAIDCGDAPPENRSVVEDCALKAYEANQPFVARWWRQGIDSRFAVGLAYTTDRHLELFTFDTAPCGGPSCKARLEVTTCRKPHIIQESGRRQVACAEPLFLHDLERWWGLH
jgi:hypothetical protein